MQASRLVFVKKKEKISSEQYCILRLDKKLGSRYVTGSQQS